jgi:hypothetical protein
MQNTEFETKNETAKMGDWVVLNNPANPLERYVVKGEKFSELYDVAGAVPAGDGISIFQAKNNLVRECVIITPEILNFIVSPLVPQAEALSIFKGMEKRECQKTSQVRAWQWEQGDGVVETHILKSDNNPHIFNLVAPWGGEMPVKLNDSIIVMEDECYRVAEGEFNRTYELLS